MQSGRVIQPHSVPESKLDFGPFGPGPFKDSSQEALVLAVGTTGLPLDIFWSRWPLKEVGSLR